MNCLRVNVGLEIREDSQCLQLRREGEMLIHQAVVERFFTQPVASQPQRFLAPVPDGKRKHPVELIQRRFHPPLAEGGQHHFRVAGSRKACPSSYRRSRSCWKL